MMNGKKLPTEQQALEKMQRYCAYQERCTHEVRQKLADMGIRGGQADGLVQQLAEEQYLDDARFARVYVLGKLKNNGWGKIRLSMELRQRRVDSGIVEYALGNIDIALYMEVLERVLRNKYVGLVQEGADNVVLRLMRFGAMRGFEVDVVRSVLHKMGVEGR